MNILKKYVQDFTYCVLRRNVVRKIHNEKFGVHYKIGVHFIFKDIVMTKTLAKTIRSEFLNSPKVLEFVEKFDILETDELVDKSVIPIGVNCTILSPGEKPGVPGHYIPILTGSCQKEKLTHRELSRADEDVFTVNYIYEYMNT